MNNYPNLKIISNKKKYILTLKRSVLSNKMTLGPKCFELEEKLKNILNVKYAVLTTSGTNALMMAALALKVKTNDKVICSNLAWVAATNPILITGGRVIVVDCNKDSELVSFEKLNESIKKHKPKVVILVHLNGQCSYNDEFDKLKKKLKFKVIEDAAQAFLSKTDENKSSGTKYEIGCFSLSIAKPIHMIYGGFCVTNSKKIADKLIAIRDNGVSARGSIQTLSEMKGLNLRPSDLHAGIGLVNLKDMVKKKKILLENYKIYEKNISNNKIKVIKLEGKFSVPNFATVIVKNEKKFYKYCVKNKISITKGCSTLTQTKIIFGNKKNLKNSYLVSKNLFRLPFGTGYKPKEILKISKILNNYK
jgi:perosamine synthetase